MNRLTFYLVLSFMFMVVGCAPRYTLVENQRVDIADKYSVEPQIRWNQMVFPEDNRMVWTVNGSNLDRLLFVSHVKDGDTLFADPKKEKLPIYRKGMNVIEISELYADTIKADGTPQLEVLDLQSRKFGPFEGLILEARRVETTGLVYRELVAGAVIDGELFIIAYTAVEMEYYPKYLEHVKRLLGSIHKI